MASDGARYTVFLKPSAERALKKMPPDVLVRVSKVISRLSLNPRPPGVTALQGEPGCLRLRVGDYRLIYTVQDDVLTVLVVTVGHRREVYRRR
ncbi:MAG: type II toxin-antitoxin system RelE/ParE family toxin [Vicinamibacterales bacterium]